jgi:hypothetical protein
MRHFAQNQNFSGAIAQKTCFAVHCGVNSVSDGQKLSIAAATRRSFNQAELFLQAGESKMKS